MTDSSWDKTDWKARAETLAELLDGFREDARRYRHLLSLAQPHADGWRIDLPGDLDMPFGKCIDAHERTSTIIAGARKG